MKIIISDLDGTMLMQREETLHSSVKTAIGKILNHNIIFCVASGRSYSELKRIMRDIKGDVYYIASDGAVIVHNDEILCENKLTKGDLSCLDDKDDYVLHGMYVSYVHSAKDLFVRNIKKQYHGHVIRIDNVDEAKDVYKISLYNSSKNLPLNIVYNHQGIREYVSHGTDKGQAVKSLLKSLDISKSDAVSFGDSDNDVTMFSETGVSYAMIHSSPKVKKAATDISLEFWRSIDNIVKE